MWYKVTFSTLFGNLLPVKKRKSKTLAFLNLVAADLQFISDRVLYKMKHTSQVIYIEKVLNEFFTVPAYDPKFHKLTKKVYITSAPRPPRKYIYQTAENHPMYLNTVYLGTINTVNYRFIVHIPSSYEFEESVVRAKVDYYKLLGKRYIIQTYDL